MTQLTLVLPYPVSANVYWASRTVFPKGGGKPFTTTYVTEEAKAYREAVAWTAQQAGVRQLLTGRLALHLQLFPHRPLDYKKRMRELGDLWDEDVRCIDLGNAEKVLSDALQATVIDNDKGFWRIVLDRMEPDEYPARVQVTITTVQRVATVQPPLFELPAPELELLQRVEPMQALPSSSGPARKSAKGSIRQPRERSKKGSLSTVEPVQAWPFPPRGEKPRSAAEVLAAVDRQAHPLLAKLKPLPAGLQPGRVHTPEALQVATLEDGTPGELF